MKAKHLIIRISVIISMVSNDVKGQYSWYDVGNGVDGTVILLENDSLNNLLYLTGQFTNVGNSTYARHASSWDGNQYHVLGCPDGWDVYGMPYYGVCVNGLLYACGSAAFAHDSCQSFPLLNKFLYNGNHWDSAGSEWGAIFQVNFMTTYQGKIIAGGQIWVADTGGNAVTVNHIVQLDNGYWKGLGNFPDFGVTWNNPSPFIWDAIEFNGELYINGNFNMAGGVTLSNPGHAKWNGTSWSSVGNTQTSRGRYGVYDNELYLGQYGGNKIFKWNGTDWTIFAEADTSSPCRFTSLIQWDSSFIVSGQFLGINGTSANNIALWDGSQWHSMESGLKYNGDSINAIGNSLAVFQGSLYVGGSFNSAGNTITNNIARWSLFQNTSDNSANNQITIYPNPTSSELHISIPSGQCYWLSVYDGTGRSLLQKAFNKIVDVSHLPGGFYILNCRMTDGNIISLHFIKMLF